MTPPLRLAIAQVPMHWELADNVRAMKDAMAIAAADGATICAFSELALTGFHRRIVEWAKPEVALPAMREIQDAARVLGLAAAFGAPTFDDAGRRFNSHVFVERDGSLCGAVSKNGLTEPEATFFTAGTTRPTVDLAGLRCSAVICRESEDRDDVLAQLRGSRVELIFWPGQMRPDPAKPSTQDPPEHVVQAQDLARSTGAYVVQTNWPNALNRPEESAETGRSACIAPSGELLFRLPVQGFGVAVFELGEREWRWHARPAHASV